MFELIFMIVSVIALIFLIYVSIEYPTPDPKAQQECVKILGSSAKGKALQDCEARFEQYGHIKGQRDMQEMYMNGSMGGYYWFY